MTINAIFAVDHYGGMGLNGTMPWPHNSEDLKHFQTLTTGHVVVMGRNTWDDPRMPKPLPGRTVYVASNRRVANAAQISGNIVQEVAQLEKNHPDQIIWIIGGPALIESCVNLLDNVYLTHFKNSYRIDTKIELKKFLAGFKPVRAIVAKDFQSTMVKYANIFRVAPTSS